MSFGDWTPAPTENPVHIVPLQLCASHRTLCGMKWEPKMRTATSPKGAGKRGAVCATCIERWRERKAARRTPA